jgi:ADP-ribose pyrophosphatase YjhB (NUDIX family)
MINDQIVQRVAFKAVIVDSKNRILMLREADTYEEGTNKGKYHFPGGRLEPGEKWEVGLRREVEEETGFKNVKIGQPLFVGEWSPVIKGVQNQIIALFVVCRVDDTEEVILSDEHDSYKWLGEGETPSDGVIMVPDDEVIEAYYKK